MEMFRLGHKKRRGAKFLSIAYLYNQALALPLPKDKQTKALPTPSDIIYPLRPNNPKHIYTKTHSTYGELHLIYIYKFTHANASLHHRCRKIQICEI